MNFISGITATYSSDRALFKKLGLKIFEADSEARMFVGEPKLAGDKNVKIWVSCTPAMFWEFELKTDSGEVIKIETGSGKLGDYWRSVEKVLADESSIEKLESDMFVVTRVYCPYCQSTNLDAKSKELTKCNDCRCFWERS